MNVDEKMQQHTDARSLERWAAEAVSRDPTRQEYEGLSFEEASRRSVALCAEVARTGVSRHVPRHLNHLEWIMSKAESVSHVRVDRPADPGVYDAASHTKARMVKVTGTPNGMSIGTKVVDNETGEEFRGIRRLDIAFPVGELCTVTAEFLLEEIIVLGRLFPVVMCPRTGKKRHVAAIEFADGERLVF